MQRCYELLPFPAQIFVTFLLEKVTNKDKTCCNFFEFGFVFLVLKCIKFYLFWRKVTICNISLQERVNICNLFVGNVMFIIFYLLLSMAAYIQRMPEIISVGTCRWIDSPCRWIILVHIFILSVLAAGLKFRSARLFESSVRYSAKAKYRPNEVPLGDFNFQIRHKNVDIMNCNPSAEILKEFFLSIETKKTIS